MHSQRGLRCSQPTGCALMHRRMPFLQRMRLSPVPANSSTAPPRICPRQPHHPTTQHKLCAATDSPAASAAVQQAAERVSTTANPVKGAQVTIIGAGPAGLATAIMLAQRGYTKINVYERMPEPPAPDDLSIWADFDTPSERLYMIGINGRGQAALRKLGVMERVDRFSTKVRGRMDWTPGSTKPRKLVYTDRTYVTRCIQRDRLAACLLQEVRDRFSQQVHISFNVDCVGVEWVQSAAPASSPTASQEVCRLKLVQRDGSAAAAAAAAEPEAMRKAEWVEESVFVVGADGAGSAVRDSMQHVSQGRFSVRRFPDTNTLVYRTIPLFFPEQHDQPEGHESTELEWPKDLNYSSRTGSNLNLDALPTREGPHIGVVLYRPGCKAVEQVARDSKDGPGAAAAARAFFQQHFPMFLPALREQDLARFAAKKDSQLPRFSFAGPVLHHGQTTCLVGDTIHTVKPYFGQGVNSAFEDVKVLDQALEETNDNLGLAVQRYSELRARDTEALVQLSRSLDGGFLTFIGPLILDSTLHRLLPGIFSPNIIASLQNENWSFSQVQQRKRVDRAMQVALLGTVAALVATFMTKLLKLMMPGLLLLLKRLTGH